MPLPRPDKKNMQRLSSLYAAQQGKIGALNQISDTSQASKSSEGMSSPVVTLLSPCLPPTLPLLTSAAPLLYPTFLLRLLYPALPIRLPYPALPIMHCFNPYALLYPCLLLALWHTACQATEQGWYILDKTQTLARPPARPAVPPCSLVGICLPGLLDKSTGVVHTQLADTVVAGQPHVPLQAKLCKKKKHQERTCLICANKLEHWWLCQCLSGVQTRP